MEVTTAYYFLTGLAFITICLGLFYGPWQTMVIATTRQYIFELRDAWFDAIADNPEHIDTEANRRLREWFNSLIQITDIFTWLTLLVFMSFRNKSVDPTAGLVSHPLRGMPHGDLNKFAQSLIRFSVLYISGAILARSIFTAPLGIALLAQTRRHARALCQRGYDLSEVLTRQMRVLHQVERVTLSAVEDREIRGSIRFRHRALAA
jgi:hypothetical protein